MIGYVGAVGSAGRFEGVLEAWATSRRTPTINTTANPASGSPRRVRFTTFLRCFSLINNPHAGIRGWRFLDRRRESRRAAVLGGDNDAVVERAHRLIIGGRCRVLRARRSARRRRRRSFLFRPENHRGA